MTGGAGEAICESSATSARPTEPQLNRGGRPRTTGGHKLHQLEKAAQKLALERIVPPALLEWRTELVRDLGGAESLSVQRLQLVELAIRDKLLLDSVDAWMLALGPSAILNRRNRRAYPILAERGRLADNLQRRLEALGLDRVQAQRRLTAAEYARRGDSEATR